MNRKPFLLALVAVACGLLSYAIVMRFMSSGSTSVATADAVVQAPVAMAASSSSPATRSAGDVNNPKVYAIEGMHCQDCANLIKQRLEATPGVKQANVSFEDKNAIVSF